MNYRKKMLLLTLLSLAAAPQAAAAAKNDGHQGKQLIRVEITEDMQNAESVYQTALKKLTEEQQAYLTYLDETLIRTLNPDAQLMQTEAYLQNCTKTDEEMSEEPEKYHAALDDFRQDVTESQAKRWEQQRDLYAKADFIDPDILRRHLQVEKAMILAVFDTMVKKNIEEGNYDCTLIKDKLSGYL